METESLLCDFVAQVARKIDQDRRQILRCANLLTESEAWSRPNAHCNSVANQILHLTGNMRQWVLGGLDRQSIQRDRPAEFAACVGPLSSILRAFEKAVDEVTDVIGRLDAPRLCSAYSIQGYEISGLIAVFHVAEHVSFHAGQIVHITKTIKNMDLSLYDTQGRNEGTLGKKLW